MLSTNYIGEYIKKYRGDMSLREFANKCGISHTHLDSIEKGFDPRTGKPVSVSVETLKKIANAMNMTINDLLIRSGDVKIEELNFDNAKLEMISSESTKIPVLGVIKAGIPIEAQQDILEYIEVPKSWHNGKKKFYGLRVSGDSMFPKYQDNDIVIFEDSRTYEPIMANNKDCAVMVNGNDATFKKVQLTQEGITLIPYNTGAYDIKMYSKKDIQEKPIKIIGIAKEKRTKID